MGVLALQYAAQRVSYYVHHNVDRRVLDPTRFLYFGLVLHHGAVAFGESYHLA